MHLEIQFQVEEVIRRKNPQQNLVIMGQVEDNLSRDVIRNATLSFNATTQDAVNLFKPSQLLNITIEG